MIDKEEWGKFKQKIDDMSNNIQDIKDGVQLQNGRVRKLEKWRAFLTGGWAFTVVIFTVVGFLFSQAIR